MPRDYSGYKYFKVDVNKDKVATLTINRPQVLGALTHDARTELSNVWLDFDKDEDVRVIIFTGSGRGFCAGGDFKEVNERHAKGLVTVPNLTSPMPGQYYVEKMKGLEKPIIGAINGVATGMGCVMALACDIVIAADVATFGDHHIRVGLVAGDGCCAIWPMLVGPAKAMEYLLTGDLMDAQEAYRLGLVNKVVPLADLMSTAMELATRLAHGPTVAIGLTKRAINVEVRRRWFSVQDFAFTAERRSFNTEDHVEGSRAFAEKREPRFIGK
ncbi:enoyl-CoA hydratase/isomerase family protein [Chloroflexota bacterium]